MKPKKKSTLSTFLNNDNTVGYVFALPFIIGFCFLTLVPMALSLYYSFCDYKIGGKAVLVGLENFLNLFKDKTFGNSILVTLQYVIIGVPLKLIFALLIAMLLTKPTKLQGVYRAVYYIPSLIGGSVAVALVWKQLFGSRGPIVSAIKAMGATGFNFFGSTAWAFLPLVLCNAWQFGSSMLIFLSSLKQIPTSLYEAAMVDGANPVSRFFKITLPLLTPTIFFNLVMQMINGFLAFTQCYIITQGKPMNSTLLYTVYMYQQSFEFYNTGYGAAMAWVMLLMIGLITLFLFATKRFWVYEGGL